MKKKLLVLFGIIISNICTAQNLFENQYSFLNGGEGKSICVSSDSNYVIAGVAMFRPPIGDNAIFVSKIARDGSIIWSNVYSSQASNDRIMDLKQTPDKGFIVSAISTFSLLLLKIDSLGNIHWTKKYSCQYGNDLYSLFLTSDYGFILTGSTFCTNGMIVLKIDSTGNIVWQYGYRYNISAGSSSGESIVETFDRGFIISTYFDNTGLDSQIGLLKLDSIGNVSWAAIYGEGSGINVVQTSDSNFVLLSIANVIGGHFSCIIKTDRSGNIIWNKLLNYPNQNFVLYDIIEKKNGGLLTCGILNDNLNSQLVVLELDSAGSLVNSNSYNPKLYTSGSAVLEDIDQNILLTGRVYPDSNNSYQMLFMKTDSSGFNECSHHFAVPFDTSAITKSQILLGRYVYNASKYSHQMTQVSEGSIESLCELTKATDLSNNLDFILYPNPVRNNFKIETDNYITDFHYTITDMLSTIVSSGKIEKNALFDVSTFSSGVYTFNLFGDGQTYHKMFVKE